MRRSSLQQWFLSAKKGDDVNLLKLIKVKRASWDIDVRDDKARTALILAAKAGSLASVARLLENGADPNRYFDIH
jgi:ankyrin repeat protein